MNLLRAVAVISFSLTVSNCAHQPKVSNYPAADWGTIERGTAIENARRQRAFYNPLVVKDAVSNPDITGSINDSRSWLNLSAENDPENQHLKRIINICRGC